MSAALQQWLDETLAVLVLYKTPLQRSVAFTSLSDTLKKNNATLDWFVYDNSPSSQDHRPSGPSIILRSDPANPGVSKAYNEGFKVAESTGKKWLLLLDQDTRFPADSIAKYHAAIMAFPHENCFVPRLTDRIGIISPFKFSLGNGFRIGSVMDGIQHFHKLHFVNSGVMVSINAFRQAKGYDEDFPLDFSDFAFIERLRVHQPGFILIPLTANHNHSSLQQNPTHEELKRFKGFMTAAHLFRKKYHSGNWLIVIRPFLRAVKLSLRHKTLAFVKQYFDSMRHG